MIAILIALAAVLILSVVMVTISVNALVWFLLLIIPFFVARFAAWLYSDRLDLDPPLLWYILNYGGGIACSVWYIVDYVNDKISFGYWPVICMLIFTALGAPVILLLNWLDDAIDRVTEKPAEAWKKTGLRTGYLVLALAFAVMAVVSLCISLSLIFPALGMLVFAAVSFVLAKSPKDSIYILGKASGMTKKKLVWCGIGIFLVLVFISNL